MRRVSIPAAVWGLTVLLVPGAWAPLARAVGLSSAEILAGTVLIASYATVGALIWHHRPGHRMGWLLSSLALVHAVVLVATDYHGWAVAQDPPATGWQVAIFVEAMVWAGGFIGLPLVLLWFPDGRLPGRSWRLVEWMVGAAAICFVVSRFAPYDLVDEPGQPPLANPIGIPGADVLEVFLAPMGLLLAGSFVGAALSQVVRWRRSTGVEREQLRWLGLGAVLVLLTVVVTIVADAAGAPAVSDVTVLFVAPLLAVAIGVAVLRHDLYDVGAVARATGALVLTAIVVGCAYGAVVLGVSEIAETDRGSAAVAAVVAALFAAPVQRRARELVDRRFHGSRRRPWEAVSLLRAEAERARGDELLATVASAAVAALKLPYASVERPVPEGGWLRVAEAGDQRPTAAVTDIRYRGTVVGRLRVSSRAPSTPLDGKDLSVLGEIADHAGPLLAAVALSEDLAVARRTLVETREEERRRLRRDLHDGLGPAMAGAALRLAALARSDGLDPAVRARVGEVAADLQVSAGELRELVEGLRPPALDALGLRGALEALARSTSAPGLEVRVDGDAPALGAAEEVALYRIAAECLSNVVRHSGASNCWMRLSSGTHVVLEVADDGIGLDRTASDARDDDVHHGVGLRSIAERCAELGGTADVSPRVGGGLVVRATLPIDAPTPSP